MFKKRQVIIIVLLIISLFTGCGKPKTEPFVFSVKNIDEVRLNGESAEDFYITNTGNIWNLYYINSEKQLYGYQRKPNSDYVSEQLIAENVIHVDCGETMNYSIFLTEDGKLYGMGYPQSGVLMTESNDYIEAPILLMENVKYALCGYADIVVLKKDNSVWTWGTRIDEYGQEYMDKEVQPYKIMENGVMISGKRDSHALLLEDGTVWTWGNNTYDKCGIAGQGIVEKPMCVAYDATAIWMGKIQMNDECMDWEKWLHYGYDNGYNDNLVIKKKDGSLWACGRNIEDVENHVEQDGIVYTYVFVPCEFVQSPDIIYEGLNTYRSILEEYERACKDENYTIKQWEKIDESFAIFNHSEEYILSYSLADLTNDGTEELLLGFFHEGEYRITAIYAYDEGMIIPVCDNMEDSLNLYEGGIIEWIWGACGRGYYSYSQLQKNSGLKVNLDTVSEISKNWGGGTEEGMLYYRCIGTHIDEEEEITEAEFNAIIDQYETIPVELEWNVLEGFWDSEDRVFP